MATDQKTVELLLRFSVESKKVKDLRSELDGVGAQFITLREKANETQKKIASWGKASDEAQYFEQELAQIEEQMQAISQQAKETQAKLQDALRTPADEAKDGIERLKEMRESAEKLESVSLRLGAAGYGILSAYQSAAQSYAESANGVMDTSRKWLATTKELEQAQNRLGKVAADALNPMREQLSDIANAFADVAEQAPNTASAIAAISAGITGVGAFGGLISQGMRVTADISLLTAANLQKQAADEMLQAATQQTVAAEMQTVGQKTGGLGSTMTTLGKVAMTAAAVYLVGNIATDVANRINEERGIGGGWTFGDALKAMSPITQLLTGVKIAGNMMGDNLIGNVTRNAADVGYEKWSGVIDKLLDFIPGLETGRLRYGSAPESAGENEPIIKQEHLALYAAADEASKARIQFEKDSEQERSQIVAQAGAERARLESEYEGQRSKAIGDFARNENRLEQDYYNQRKQAAAQYGKEIRRMEEDHQRNMRRMLEDHNQRSGELASSRDALGFMKEQRSYETQRQRAEQDYNIQARRRSQDFADQMAQMENNFATQRERRQQDFDARLVEMDAQHAQQMQKYDQQTAETLRKLDERNAKELKQLQDNETQRWKTLKDVAINGLTETQAAAIEMSKKYLTDYKEWLEKQKTTKPGYGQKGGLIGPPAPGFATGGYVENYGAYNLAEQGREFVLSNGATRAAERLMGRRLNQQDLLNNLAAGGRGGSTINLSLPGGLVTIPVLNDILNARFQGFGDDLQNALGALA